MTTNAEFSPRQRPNLAAKQPNLGGFGAKTSLPSGGPTSAAPKLRREATIAIAGMGLIGGSFHKALTRAGHDVVGFDKGDVVRVEDADLIIVALAPKTAVDWICLHADEFRDGAIVVDTCGVKGAVIAALRERGVLGGRFTFVGGHPMAGKAVGGYANSDADLFKGASMILTPDPGTPDAVIDTLRAVFSDAGFARTVLTDVARHDEMIAFTSQLCHVISSAYLRDELASLHDGFSAGSYRDMTRVGAPDPVLWAELFTLNRDALVPVLDRFIGRLSRFREAMAADDVASLEEQIGEGRAASGTADNRWC